MPMHTTVSAALARKMRLESEESRAMELSQCEIQIDRRAILEDDEWPRLLRDTFIPRRHRVGAGRNAIDSVAALVVGHREEAMGEHENERIHVRMDVAEDPHDAWIAESHRLRSSLRIAAEIERPRLRQRKH